MLKMWQTVKNRSKGWPCHSENSSSSCASSLKSRNQCCFQVNILCS